MLMLYCVRKKGGCGCVCPAPVFCLYDMALISVDLRCECHFDKRIPALGLRPARVDSPSLMSTNTQLFWLGFSQHRSASAHAEIG